MTSEADHQRFQNDALSALADAYVDPSGETKLLGEPAAHVFVSQQAGYQLQRVLEEAGGVRRQDYTTTLSAPIGDDGMIHQPSFDMEFIISAELLKKAKDLRNR